MPSVNDIISVAEALEKSPIAVLRDRCVAVRNRNSSCRRCVKSCHVGAIKVQGNEVELSALSCTACGACAVACPTGALAPLGPTDAELAQRASQALREARGTAAIACARMASKKQADPATYAEVPCLSRVDESVLLDLAAQGAEKLILVDGTCATCKYRACSGRADETVAFANALLERFGSGVRVQRVSGFPDELAIEDAEGRFGTTRRGFFSDAASAARDTAMTAAKTTIAQDLGLTRQDPSIGERLRVTEAGTLPLIRVPRRETAINALDRLGTPTDGPIHSRLFASVSIDASRCNSCGMCAVFCPTGAIRRDPADKPSDPIRYLEFWASDCVQCGLCADVCWKGALTLSESVEAGELFDFEPREFALGQAGQTGRSLFGK